MRLNKTIPGLSCLYLALAVVVLQHCASSGKMKDLPPDEPAVFPAGVDSSVALEADSISKELFVTHHRQLMALEKAMAAEAKVDKSEALWQVLQARENTLSVSPEDTLKAIEKFNKGGIQLQEAMRIQKDSEEDAQIREQVQNHLSLARVEFEQAVRLNPFDRNSRLWLARVYQMVAQRFLRTSDWAKAAEVLENLVRMDGSQHGIYGRLAQCYASLHAWQASLRNFRAAEAVQRQTAVFQVPESERLDDRTIAAALDSSALFLYVYYQAESHIRMYAADSALFQLERASAIARSPEDRSAVKSTTDWIDWDDGNIAAAEMRDSLLTLVDEKKYADAARGFSDLFAQLRTARARRETDWRLALLEFSFLDRQEQALQRMQKVVKYYEEQRTQAQSDTLYEQYCESYGTMCHNQGLKALTDQKFPMALAYFEQAVRVPWKLRSKSYLEIAKLSINNPGRAVGVAEKALADRDRLSEGDQLKALEVLIESLKRTQQFDLATKYFREFRELSRRVRANGISQK
jgi:tetratricopeptide (TPR) repeat protein